MALKRPRQAFEADLRKQESPYVVFGTPLPPLDEHTRDDGSFVPIWKQEVTDDRGRKRLHGAFTGGFSAGYFNTVGSKEGWTPATFVSSRQNRMKDARVSSEQKAEDYMDEEDLREAEESRQLQTSDQFSGFGTEDDELRKHTILDIFRPPDESMGVKLLRCMGWKEGQGIGPRVRRIANLHDDGDQGESHLFAPHDVSPVSLIHKSDHQGLGYGNSADGLPNAGRPKVRNQPISAEDEPREYEDDSRHFFSLHSAKVKSKPAKSAFGVGVLHDTGSDDEDPYSMGPQISYNKVLGGDKKAKKKPSIQALAANPTIKSKPIFQPKKFQNVLRKCHDGRLPLDGFVLADELNTFSSLSLSNDKYRPPAVPEGWKSSLIHNANEEDIPAPVSVAEAARNSTMDAKARALALGETQLPGKSVFDYLTPAARDRLSLASGRRDLPPARSERHSSGYQPDEDQQQKALQELVPKLDQDVALQALSRGSSGWMPYAEDEAKRARYRTYLEIRAGLRGTTQGDELPTRLSGMSQPDWVTEMHEFARAAEVFRPVTGLMASRFTSSSSSLPQASGNGTDTLLSKPATKPEDPAETAARMGMFGPMTRSVITFTPTRLVCKRFNVPMPDHAIFGTGSQAQPEVSAEQREKVMHEGSTQMHGDVPAKANPTVHVVADSKESEEEAPVALPVAHVDPEMNEALEQKRPGQALFKAIFGSDDEDSDEDEV